MSAAEKQSDQPSDVITVDELAARLRVSRLTLYAMIQQRKVPGVIRVGRVIRISKAAIEKWLAEGDPRPGRPRSGT